MGSLCVVPLRAPPSRFRASLTEYTQGPVFLASVVLSNVVPLEPLVLMPTAEQCPFSSVHDYPNHFTEGVDC